MRSVTESIKTLLRNLTGNNVCLPENSITYLTENLKCNRLVIPVTAILVTDGYVLRCGPTSLINGTIVTKDNQCQVAATQERCKRVLRAAAYMLESYKDHKQVNRAMIQNNIDNINSYLEQ